MTTPPHSRVSRADWLLAAREALVADGIDRVRVASLATQLDVARSSFYWYFRDRDDLTAALLDEWEEHNTASLIDRAARPADTITGALLHVFECWADPRLFDVQLEFAVRAWARTDHEVRARLGVAESVDERLRLVTEYVTVFTGVEPSRSETRAFARWIRALAAGQ